jgi:hypothetical protein
LRRRIREFFHVHTLNGFIVIVSPGLVQRGATGRKGCKAVHLLGQRREGVVFVFLTTRRYLAKIEVLMMSSANPTELAKKEAGLTAAIEETPPDFAMICRAQDTPVVIMHQDAFAADYQEEEYLQTVERSPTTH